MERRSPPRPRPVDRRAQGCQRAAAPELSRGDHEDLVEVGGPARLRAPQAGELSIRWDWIVDHAGQPVAKRLGAAFPCRFCEVQLPRTPLAALGGNVAEYKDDRGVIGQGSLQRGEERADGGAQVLRRSGSGRCPIDCRGVRAEEPEAQPIGRAVAQRSEVWR
jgi:hypothetical protein